MTHEIKIGNGKVALDDFELNGVVSYKLEGLTPIDKATLTVVLLVDNPCVTVKEKVAAGTTTDEIQLTLDNEKLAKQMKSFTDGVVKAFSQDDL